MTKQELIDNHRKMWNWIAEEIKQSENLVNLTSIKHRYMRENLFYDIECSCFLCEGAHEYGCCILDWENDDNECMIGDSYLNRAWHTKSWQEQYLLCLKIANLKEKE